MTQKVVIGIIGCGMIVHHHINSLSRIKEVEIKWICDISTKSLNEVSHKYCIPNSTTNYWDILNDIVINAVIICTPPYTHYQIVMDAISAKKHILVEKPLAITKEQLSILHNKIQQHQDLIILDCAARHSRLQPKFLFIKEMIKSGKLGNVYCIHHNAIYRNSRPGIEFNPQSQWFYQKHLSGGGPMMDWGVYDLSFHLGILQESPKLKSVKSFLINGLDQYTINHKYFNVEEHGIVFMEFHNDLVYYWERSSNAHNNTVNETRIYGTQGGLKFDYLSWGSNEITYYYYDENNVPKEDILYVDMQYHNIIPGPKSIADDSYALSNHFINCLLHKEQTVLPLSQSIEYLDIIFKATDTIIYPEA